MNSPEAEIVFSSRLGRFSAAKVLLIAAALFLVGNLLANILFFSINNVWESDTVSFFHIMKEYFVNKIYTSPNNYLLRYLFHYPIFKLLGYSRLTVVLLSFINLLVVFMSYILFYMSYIKANYSDMRRCFIAILCIAFLLNQSHILYYFLGYPFSRNFELGIAFIVLFLIQRFISSDTDLKKQIFLYSIICLVTGLIFFSDPYLVFTIGLSFLLSETLLNFYFTLKGDKIEPRISGIILCSLLLAYSMRILLNKSGYFFITGESASFVEFSKLGFNISLFAQGMLKLFSGFFPGERILSFPAVLHFANLGILLAGSYGMYLLFRKKFMQRDSIGVFIPVCFLVTILAYVLSNRAIDIQCTRYLVLVPFLFAFGLYFLIDERVAGKTATVVFSLVLALAVAANFIHISANYHIKPLRTQGGDPKIPQILLNEGLTYGYSDFWHAAINTFTSKETVRIRQIACMDGRIGPLHWISSEQWYRPDAFVGKTFLLVDYHGAGKPFFEKCSTDMIINQFGMPEKQLQFDVDGSSLLLMIFNYNISQHF